MAGAVLGTLAAGPTGRMLSTFDPKVMEIAEKSPTLAAQLAKLEQQGGWTIKLDPTSTSYYTDFENGVIVINGGATPQEIVGKIAHEVGHASHGDTFVKPTATMTRDEFVKANVDAVMPSEGAAQLNAATVRDEILKAGGPDPGIPGSQTAAYQSVYDDYKAGKITRAEAIEKMGNLMGNEVPRGSTKKYRDNYAEGYGDYWDKYVAPGRKTP